MTSSGEPPRTSPIELVYPKVASLGPRTRSGSFMRARRRGHWKIEAWHRPDLSRADMQQFEKWAQRAGMQLLQSGDPHANGWSPARPGGEGEWYMVGTVQDVPLDPFL